MLEVNGWENHEYEQNRMYEEIKVLGWVYGYFNVQKPKDMKMYEQRKWRALRAYKIIVTA